MLCLLHIFTQSLDLSGIQNSDCVVPESQLIIIRHALILSECVGTVNLQGRL